MAEWQPISSAPKDGTVILAWNTDVQQAELIWWAAGEFTPHWVIRDSHEQLHDDWIAGWQAIHPPVIASATTKAT